MHVLSPRGQQLQEHFSKLNVDQSNQMCQGRDFQETSEFHPSLDACQRNTTEPGYYGNTGGMFSETSGINNEFCVGFLFTSFGFC